MRKHETRSYSKSCLFVIIHIFSSTLYVYRALFNGICYFLICLNHNKYRLSHLKSLALFSYPEWWVGNKWVNNCFNFCAKKHALPFASENAKLCLANFFWIVFIVLVLFWEKTENILFGKEINQVCESSVYREESALHTVIMWCHKIVWAMSLVQSTTYSYILFALTLLIWFSFMVIYIYHRYQP